MAGARALITGGASGIGEATARHLHKLGVSVALLDRNAERLAATANELDASCAAVVNVASASGVRPTLGEAPYSAAKAGLISLTQSAAMEAAPDVRVNCVAPGFVATPLNQVLLDQPGVEDALGAGTLLGRVSTADEVARTITFLLSDDASYITGQNLVVDGGSLLPNSQVDPVLGPLIGPT